MRGKEIKHFFANGVCFAASHYKMQIHILILTDEHNSQVLSGV